MHPDDTAQFHQRANVDPGVPLRLDEGLTTGINAMLSVSIIVRN
ncbi:hypothetical protein [Amycolatopsis sp. NPDC098790]